MQDEGRPFKRRGFSELPTPYCMLYLLRMFGVGDDPVWQWWWAMVAVSAINVMAYSLIITSRKAATDKDTRAYQVSPFLDIV